MKKLLFLVCIVFLAMNLFSQSDLKLMTEEYPPYNFNNEGKLEGMAIELMDEMLKVTSSGLTKDDIQLLPWARGYNVVQRDENSCLFSMTRSEQREKMFKWVGPISKTTVVVFAKKSNNIKIEKPEDLTKHTVTAIREDIGEQLLIDKGVFADKIDSSSDAAACINKLFYDRVQLWAYEENVGKWLTKKAGFDPNKLERVYTLTESELHFAFNLKTSDEVIIKFQKALDSIKASGKYDEILAKYLK